MASNPIPEPFANQEVETEKEPQFGQPAAPLRVEDTPAASGQRINDELRTPDPSMSEIDRSALKVEVMRADVLIGVEPTAPTERYTEVAREVGENLKDAVAEKAALIGDQAKAAFDEARRVIRANYRDARYAVREGSRRNYERLQQIAQDKPLHLIATCAGAGFVLGVLLRIWRSNRYE